MAGTCAMVTHVDAEIGRVLTALEEEGGLEDTLIIFLSDHGDMMGDHGFFWKGIYTHEGCVRIPTVVRPPNTVTSARRGQQSEALISHIDLLPTILEYTSVPHPGSLASARNTIFTRLFDPVHSYPGRSWWNLVAGSEAAGRTCIRPGGRY